MSDVRGFACQHCGGDPYYCAKKRRGLIDYTPPASLTEWELKLVGELPAATPSGPSNGWKSVLVALARQRDEEARYFDRGLPPEVRGLRYVVAIGGSSYEMEA